MSKSLSLLLLIIAAIGACAQEPPVLERGPALDAFMDGVFATLMDENHVPGLTCSIVKNGEVFFEKGYGLAHIEETTPVDPATSLFEVASVSKLFTATAVMQQVEQGKLDLDVDVNTYIKGFKIPATYPEPITLRHLLTHTPGFEERSIGMGTRDPGKMVPLSDFMRDEIPARVRPPGVTLAYSNYGAALAGYIVECVPGQDFAEYVRERILEPLGMARSSFRRGEVVQAALAHAYQFRGGKFVSKPNNYMIDYPAGALVSSAGDMAKFMMAHLNAGAGILQPETAVQMHGQFFTHDPRLTGIGGAFFEEVRNGHRAIFHDGYLRGFASLCYLVPDEKVGIFISNNGDSTPLWRSAKNQFMDRFFPAPGPLDFPPAADDFAARMAPFTGYYRPTRHAYNTVEKLGVFLDPATVSVGEAGTIVVSGGSTSIYREVEPYFFLHVEDGRPLLFRPAPPEGRAMLISGAFPSEQLAWWETPPYQMGYLAAILVVLASAALTLPLLGLYQCVTGVTTPRAPRTATLIGFTAAAHVAWLAGLLYTMTSTDTYEFVFGVPPVMISLIILAQGAAALSVLSVLALPALWWTGALTLRGRLALTAIATTTVAVLPFMVYWNLLGLNW